MSNVVAEISPERPSVDAMFAAIGIAAHVVREEMARDLAALVQPQLVSLDQGVMGANTNHKFVWAQLAKIDSEWSVVLEDDAVPCISFREHLTNALEAAPTPVVSLYLGKERPPQFQHLIPQALKKVEDSGACWIRSAHLLHAVGVAVKTDYVLEMLSKLSASLPIDQAIGRWARQTQKRIGYVVPSLVDHADTPTLIQHQDLAEREPGRVAWRKGTRLYYNSRFEDLGV